MAVTASELILAYTYDRNGDWDAIIDDIRKKKEFDFTATPIASIKSKIFGNYTTLIDDDFPPYAKNCKIKQPFCLFYKGNLNAIEENKSILVYACRSSKSPALEKYARYALVQTIKKYAPKHDIILKVSKEYHDLAVKAFRKYAGPDSHIAEILQYLNISDYFLTFSERSDLVMSVRYTTDYTIEPHGGVITTALQASKKVVIVEGDKDNVPAVVHFALVENKDVEVVPYPFFDKEHSNNGLISEGALMFGVEEQEEEEYPMAKYQVKEVIRFLGANSVGYFTGTITDYNWAKQQMETRFMKYVHEYKNNHPKVSMGRMSCKLTLDDGDFIEVTIQDLEKGGAAV